MAKQLVFGEVSRNRILNGVTTIAKAVKSTLGPAGRNVVIERGFGSPVITKDGVSVAKEVHLKDRFENMGAQLVKEVSSKTNDIVGDGTTSSVVLAEAIFGEGLKNVAAGANPVYLSRGINKAAQILCDKLKEVAVPVDTTESIRNVATVSANWDTAIGDVIAAAMEAVGKDGTITVEEGNSLDTTMDTTQGMQFERGYMSPLFLSDSDAASIELDKPVILCMDKKLTTLRSCIDFLQKVQQANRPLLIIAESVEGEALSTMVINHMRGALRCCAVMAPGFGDRRKAMLKDIAIVTGGIYVAEELGINLNDLDIAQLGSADKVVVTKDSTTIIGGHGDEEAIQARAESVRKEIEAATNTYDKEKQQERLASLAGGVAVIKVGAVTETEMKEKKDRIDDALHAARAAVAEGIVPGGGSVLVKLRKSLLDAMEDITLLPDERTGVRIVYNAVTEPIKQIVRNAGGNAELVAAEVEKNDNFSEGYNALTGEYVDMMSKGIVDPAKVVRVTLQNGASIAGLMLTTECLIVDDPDKEKEHSHDTPMFGM